MYDLLRDFASNYIIFQIKHLKPSRWIQVTVAFQEMIRP